jgi:hypothetical protein
MPISPSWVQRHCKMTYRTESIVYLSPNFPINKRKNMLRDVLTRSLWLVQLTAHIFVCFRRIWKVCWNDCGSWRRRTTEPQPVVLKSFPDILFARELAQSQTSFIKRRLHGNKKPLHERLELRDKCAIIVMKCNVGREKRLQRGCR